MEPTKKAKRHITLGANRASQKEFRINKNAHRDME
jgi:hypothetical protein